MGITNKYNGTTIHGGPDNDEMYVSDILYLDPIYDQNAFNIIDEEERTVAVSKFVTPDWLSYISEYSLNIGEYDAVVDVDDLAEDGDSYEGYYVNPVLYEYDKDEYFMVRDFLKKEDVEFLFKVIAIENRACYADSRLTSVIITAQTITSIGRQAFSNCDNLEEVEISSPITKIEAETFRSCKKIPEIILPETIVAIEENAFFGCESLKLINLGKSLTEVGESAFANCSNMETILCNAIVPPSLNESSFSEETMKKATLFVPKGTIEAYKNSDWKNFINIEELYEDGAIPEVPVETIIANAKSVCNVNINFSIVETDKGLFKIINNDKIIDDYNFYIDAASKFKELRTSDFDSLTERIERLKTHVEQEQNSEKATTATSTANNIFEDVKEEAHLENNNLSIFRLKSGTIKVLNNGVEIKNAMDGIRAMAILVGYKVNETNSNTRQEGARLIDFINENKK